MRVKFEKPNYEKFKYAKYLLYDIESYINGLFFGEYYIIDDKLNKVDEQPYLFFEDDVKELVDNVYKHNIILVGFNNHHYDNPMLANIYFGEKHTDASHQIINVPFSQASEYDLLCRSIDLFMDVQGSLKYNQAVFGMSIKESGVGFDIDRPLTEEEYQHELEYCLHDIDATYKFFVFRMQGGATSIQNKLNLLNKYQLPHTWTRKTDNEIVAHILGGQSADWNTAYDNLFDINTLEDVVKKHLHNIPKDIINMYRNYHKDYAHHVKNVTNKKVFKKKYTEKFKKNIFDLETLKYLSTDDPIYKEQQRRIFLNKSFGGEHTFNFYEVVKGKLKFADFGSYYPSIINVFLRHLQNTKNPDIYGELLKGRIDNKVTYSEIKNKLTEEESNMYKVYNPMDSDCQYTYDGLTDNVKELIRIDGEINGIKLILNKAFGVMGSPTNALFNPIKLSTVTVLGQLLITELIFRVLNNCKSAMLVQSNTDGVLFKIDDDNDIVIFEKICNDYSKEINISIDIEDYDKIIQSTVNNYILKDGDKFKLKGATTKNYKGLSNLEQNSRLTNNLSIKSKALVDYFTKGISVEDTVNNETDITRFQYIASSNGKIVGFYNKTTNGWELKNNRIMVLKDSKDEIVKITKSNVNNVLENKLDESNFQLIDAFKRAYERNKGSVSELSIAQHTGVKVTNVVGELTDDYLQKIDKDFYIRMCRDHINTFIKGNIEEEE